MTDVSSAVAPVSRICTNPWTSAFVWGNGDVTHCAYANTGAVGNIKHSSLAEIWNGPKITRIRQHMRRENYLRAGCEHYCRVFRWYRYFRDQDQVPAIPEGFGRIQEIDLDQQPVVPAIISIAIDGMCNLHCRHCIATKETRGLSYEQVVELSESITRARVVRIINGEPTINPQALRIIEHIAALEGQPTLFLNSHGQTPLQRYLPALEPLASFHLKLSLEGMGQDYEQIRVGGRWDRFLDNLHEAKQYFQERRASGDDWRLYLNYCVMKSNFPSLPETIAFARQQDLPLVLNTINGMRHLDQNIFMYRHLVPSAEQQRQVRSAVDQVLTGDNPTYAYAEQVDIHLHYIFRTLQDRKLWLPAPFRRLLSSMRRGLGQDRMLYMLYKLRVNPASLLLYIWRKARKTIRLRLRRS